MAQSTASAGAVGRYRRHRQPSAPQTLAASPAQTVAKNRTTIDPGVHQNPDGRSDDPADPQRRDAGPELHQQRPLRHLGAATPLACTAPTATASPSPSTACRCNDSGNYATFTNQLLDSELISSAQVNTGSTDVDSPTAASTGGTISLPACLDDEFGVLGPGLAGRLQLPPLHVASSTPGELGPWGTKAWAAASYQEYDKFKGEGELKKRQFNGKIYQPLGDGNNFVSHGVPLEREPQQRTYFGPNLRTRTRSAGETSTPKPVPHRSARLGVRLQHQLQPDRHARRRARASPATSTSRPSHGRRTTPTTGTAHQPVEHGQRPRPVALRLRRQHHAYDRPVVPVRAGQRRHPEHHGLGELQWLGLAAPAPAFQTATAGNCPLLDASADSARATPGAHATTGLDLNGDGDVNDSVRVMNPSTTNTRRFGLLGSLIWKFADDQLFRVGYTLDCANYRQTGEFGLIDFGYQLLRQPVRRQGRRTGHEDHDGRRQRLHAQPRPLLGRQAEPGQRRIPPASSSRTRLSVSVGVRAPFFERELNQYCYTQNGYDLRALHDGNPVRDAGQRQRALRWHRPAPAAPVHRAVPAARRSSTNLLPNVGVSYFVRRTRQTVYGNSYAQSTSSAPRTDNLYQPRPHCDRTTVQDFVAVQSRTRKKPTTFELRLALQQRRECTRLRRAGWTHETFKNRIVIVVRPGTRHLRRPQRRRRASSGASTRSDRLGRRSTKSRSRRDWRRTTTAKQNDISLDGHRDDAPLRHQRQEGRRNAGMVLVVAHRIRADRRS